MPTIRDSHSFRPNQIKTLWLATRKENIQGTEHPGFFQTVNFSTDRNWVIMATFIEIVAIIVTIQGGLVRGGTYLIIAIAAVLLFVFFDYIGAKLHHSPISKKQEYRCKLALVEDLQNSNESIGIRDELNRKSQKKTGGIVLIVFSAILKLVALFLLGTMGFIFLGIMVVLYVLAVYIHLNHTGYFLAEMSVRKQIGKQHSLWREYIRLISIGKKEKLFNHKGEEYLIKEDLPQRNTYTSTDVLWDHRIEENEVLNYGKHSISFIRKENGNNIYEINTLGILTDTDVRGILNSGNQINIDSVSKFLLDHQLKTNND